MRLLARNIEGEDNVWLQFNVDCRAESVFGIRTLPFINDQNLTALQTCLLLTKLTGLLSVESSTSYTFLQLEYGFQIEVMKVLRVQCVRTRYVIL